MIAILAVLGAACAVLVAPRGATATDPPATSPPTLAGPASLGRRRLAAAPASAAAASNTAATTPPALGAPPAASPPPPRRPPRPPPAASDAAATSPPGPSRRPLPGLRAAALGALALALAGTAIAVTRVERTGDGPAQGATPERLVSAQSNRYEYWRVAAREFADDPLTGGGSGSFRTDWLRERDIAETVRDAHSLYIETAAELGVIGLAALLLFLGGIVAMARRQPEPAAIAALSRVRGARGPGLGLGAARAHARRADARREARNSGRSTSNQLSVAHATEPASANTVHSTYGCSADSHEISPQRDSSASTKRW